MAMSDKGCYTAVTPASNVFRVFYYALGRTFFPSLLTTTTGRVLIAILVGEGIINTLITVGLHAVSYPITQRSIRKLAGLYLHVIFMFASIYLLLLAFSSTTYPPFHGVHGVWQEPSGSIGAQWLDILLSFVDCVHYSIVTIATVGYGDITPVTWYAKLITDLEILVGVGLVAIGVSRYFFLLSVTRDRK